MKAISVSVVRAPNAWGFYGKQDRDGYEVWVTWQHGGVSELWATYCYEGMALDIAARLISGHA